MAILGLLTIIFIHSSATPIANSQESSPTPPGQTTSVQTIKIEGNKELSTKQLERLVAPFQNRELSETDLGEIEHRVKLLYRSRGFTGTEVEASTQKSGVLTIKIKEGTTPQK